jgi:hypothetical protein
VVCDSYAMHSHPAVKAWLAKHPRITMHFTSTSASWIDVVGIFFGIITRQALRRGTFTSVSNHLGAIRIYIDADNERWEPFTWTKTADHSLTKTHAKDLRHVTLEGTPPDECTADRALIDENVCVAADVLGENEQVGAVGDQ